MINPNGFFFCFNVKCCPSLDVSLYVAGAEAASAYLHPAGRAVNDYANLLDVRSPGASGLSIGVADLVSGHYAFVAYFTKLTHTIHLLSVNAHFTISLIVRPANNALYCTINILHAQALILIVFIYYSRCFFDLLVMQCFPYGFIC